MNDVMGKWYFAAQNRVSVRNFTDAIDKPTFDELKKVTSWLTDAKARLSLQARNGVFKSLFLPRSSINGTNCFAAVIAEPRDRYLGGYLGEAFILECASRNLATCWVGAAYKKSLVKEYSRVAKGESLLCIIAVGKCDSLPHRPKKKSIERLTNMSLSTFQRLPEWQKSAIKCVQIAPSAMNAQPYEFEFKDSQIHLINTSSNFGYSEVDCGIAMLHIELGAAEYGVYGEWDFIDGFARFTPAIGV